MFFVIFCLGMSRMFIVGWCWLSLSATCCTCPTWSLRCQEQIILALNQRSHTVMVGDGTNDVGALKHAHVGISLMTTSVAPKVKAPKTPNEMVSDGQAPLVRLGDASIASPFTYKGDSIKCSIQVLRCGRATLCSVPCQCFGKLTV